MLHQDYQHSSEQELVWQGYASKYLNGNIQLKPFQLEAIRTFKSKRDCIVIQATGSGKSTCFHIPALMLKENQYGLVIVPTIALGEDHLQTLKDIKIKSVFFKSTTEQHDYEKTFDSSIKDSERTSVLIMMPEFLFGSKDHTGLIDRIESERLGFIVIDEAHLLYDWVSFRPTFGDMEKLKEKFISPILALSATLKQEYLAQMSARILRYPVVIKGSINRPNVVIHVAPYRHSSEKECLKENVDRWFATAKKILKIIGRQRSIVYCAFATDCEKLKTIFLHFGVKCESFTGKTTSAEDKLLVYNLMKTNDEVQVLVATKAFGMGINLLNIRHIFNVGIPENLALWIQQYGRAGRDRKEAHAYLLVNEHLDKKRLKFWIKETNLECEKECRRNDFVDVFHYICHSFAGKCLREFQENYFQDPATPKMKQAIMCCTGCKIREVMPFKTVEELLIILQSFSFFKKHGILKIYENRVVGWLLGERPNWMNQHFNKGDAEKDPGYGSLQSRVKIRVEELVKTILRQCFGVGYLLATIEELPGKLSIITNLWSLTDLGSEIANGTAIPVEMPDPMKTYEFLTRQDFNNVYLQFLKYK